jgi:hypothetical protein
MRRENFNKRLEKIMKILKQMFLATLVVCAINARADYTVTPGSPVNITPGDTSTHYSDYVLTVTPGDTINLNKIISSFITDWDGVLATAGFYPAGSTLNLSINQNAVPVGIYTLVVDWTLNSNPAIATIGSHQLELDVHGTVNGALAVHGESDIINIVPVPEPMQTAASCLLLGCGGLVFIGRRLVKKQA